MTINWEKKENKQLVGAVLALKDAGEAKRFLRDLLTPQEIEEFSKRLEAASLLSQNIKYDAIIDRTGLSSTTVARISKWLRGSLGGYRLILSRLSPSTSLRTGLRQHHHNPSQMRKGLLSSV